MLCTVATFSQPQMTDHFAALQGRGLKSSTAHSSTRASDTTKCYTTTHDQKAEKGKHENASDRSIPHAGRKITIISIDLKKKNTTPTQRSPSNVISQRRRRRRDISYQAKCTQVSMRKKMMRLKRRPSRPRPTSMYRLGDQQSQRREPYMYCRHSPSVAVIGAAATRAAAIPAVLRQAPQVAWQAGQAIYALLPEEPLPLSVLRGRRRDQWSKLRSWLLAVR